MAVIVVKFLLKRMSYESLSNKSPLTGSVDALGSGVCEAVCTMSQEILLGNDAAAAADIRGVDCCGNFSLE